ncbi:MAG: NADH-quinone oxidoreductase subunit NuoE [Thermoanaerobacteraceae bacterium]|nr:NADH-quinone oxidoreductase subunit NuoE [Thermoanaerobacteraceae bacterium]
MTALLEDVKEKDKYKRLHDVIDAYKDKPGALIPVMNEAQEIFGYLPFEVQKEISEGLNVPLTKVYGIATFYSRFTLHPAGKYRIGVCLGTACYVKGSSLILDKIKEKLGIDVNETTPDGKFSIDSTRCLGCCGLAPVMMINNDVYGKLSPDDVDKILEKYK